MESDWIVSVFVVAVGMKKIKCASFNNYCVLASKKNHIKRNWNMVLNKLHLSKYFLFPCIEIVFFLFLDNVPDYHTTGFILY